MGGRRGRREGGRRYRPRRPRRKEEAGGPAGVRNGGAGLAAPPAPQGRSSCSTPRSQNGGRAGRQAGEGARARDPQRAAVRRSPESAALGRAAGATRSAAWLGAVAERKSRSRLRREPALKGVGTGKPTRCSVRAHAANRNRACRPGPAPPHPNGQSQQSAPPRGRARAGRKLGWPVGCGWGHGVSSN